MRAAAALVLAAVAGVANAARLDVVSVAVDGIPVVRPGGNAVVKVTVTVKPGYHVQANPVLNPALIPITLTVAPAPHVSAGKTVYPDAKRMRLIGDDQDLVIYDGTFVIEQPVSVSKDSPAGETRMDGSLRYQACDDRRCLFPRTVPVELRLRVGE